MAGYRQQRLRTYLRHPLTVGVAGCVILVAYLLFLNNARLPLEPRLDAPLLTHVRLMVYLLLLLGILLFIRAFEARRRREGRPVRWNDSLRFLAAAAVFCLSITALDPARIKIVPHKATWHSYIYVIDLAPYFIVNTIGYAMLLYALFRIGAIRRFCDRLGGPVARAFRSHGLLWVLCASVWCFAWSYHLSWVMFRHTPWIYDTIVQLIHAKFIAAGHWFGRSPPVHLREFFPLIFMVNDGKWYSQYPPGHLLMLAAGLKLGNVALVNPFLGACTCGAVWLLAKELYGRYVARIAVLLCALCVYLIVFSSEYMNNATSLLTGTLFLYGYFRMLHRPGLRAGLLAGAALGYCFITRPYSACGLAVPIGLHALLVSNADPRRYLGPVLVMAAAFFAFFAFQLYFNSQTTGHPFAFGYMKVQGERTIPLTRMERWTPALILQRLQVNAQRLAYFNRILFEWPVPLPAALMALVFAVRGKRRDEKILFSTIALMFLSVQLVFNMDISWGPRLVYELLGILLVLCAKGLTMLPPLLRVLLRRPISLGTSYGAMVLVLASFYPYSYQYNLQMTTLREYYDLNKHNEWNPGFLSKIRENVQTPALVFVPEQYYAWVAHTNPPGKHKPVVFVLDRGKENKHAIQFYKRRNVYIVKNKSGRTTISKIR